MIEPDSNAVTKSELSFPIWATPVFPVSATHRTFKPFLPRAMAIFDLLMLGYPAFALGIW